MTMLLADIHRRRRRRPSHRPKQHRGHRHVRVGVAPGLAQGMGEARYGLGAASIACPLAVLSF